MKVSKRSWHYRFMKFMTAQSTLEHGELPPMNLCAYVTDLGFKITVFPLLCCVFCLAVPIIGVVLGISWLANKTVLWWEERPPSPSIAVAWLKAKKEKMCPMLEWEE
jgi:hypothetical protein